MNQLEGDLVPRSKSSMAQAKPMRKGTHSCTQCRRRKRRCVYQAGNAVCQLCSLRGLSCLDQQDGSSRVDQREHLAPTTLPCAAKVPEVPGTRLAVDMDRDEPHLPPTTIGQEERDLDATPGVRPPLAAALNDQDRDCELLNATHSADPYHHMTHRTIVCKELRSALPSYDAIIAVLARNGGWWESFRQKTGVISQAQPIEPLLSFAARAYTSDSPAELGTLAAAYGRSLGRGSHLFLLVERLILADFGLAATIHGMECLVLLGKTYTDIGQPKRAWLTWRKGLANAQLMGLHRSAVEEQDVRHRIWWAVYHGDRFCSLLLGLPYGFNDAHLDSSAPRDSEEASSWLPELVHRSVIVAGKVIDANLALGEIPLSRTLSLDEEMNVAYESAPAHWWNVPDVIPQSLHEREQIVTQLLIQFFFFHVKMYIYLPCLSRKTARSRKFALSTANKISCVEAAREVLMRYLMLRARADDGRFLFDCKTTDFVGFTASVVILIGSTKLNQSSGHLITEDSGLLMQVLEVFDLLADKDGCEVASQCRHVLRLLLDPLGHSASAEGSKISIPYFGTFVLAKRCVDHMLTDSTDAVARVVDHKLGAEGAEFSTLSPYYIDLSMDDLLWCNSWGMPDSVGSLAADRGTPLAVGQSMMDFDLDQDWTLWSS